MTTQSYITPELIQFFDFYISEMNFIAMVLEQYISFFQFTKIWPICVF